MSEENIDRKEFTELKELVKPIQEWLLKYYDPMCKIEIMDDCIKVYRNELHLIQYLDNEETESED